MQKRSHSRSRRLDTSSYLQDLQVSLLFYHVPGNDDFLAWAIWAVDMCPAKGWTIWLLSGRVEELVSARIFSYWPVVQAIVLELQVHACFYSHWCCMTFFYCKGFAGNLFSQTFHSPPHSPQRSNGPPLSVWFSSRSFRLKLNFVLGEKFCEVKRRLLHSVLEGRNLAKTINALLSVHKLNSPSQYNEIVLQNLMIIEYSRYSIYTTYPCPSTNPLDITKALTPVPHIREYTQQINTPLKRDFSLVILAQFSSSIRITPCRFQWPGLNIRSFNSYQVTLLEHSDGHST